MGGDFIRAYVIILGLLLAWIFNVTGIWAQTAHKINIREQSHRGVETSGYCGYQLNSNINVKEGQLVLKDNPNFGFAIDIPLPIIRKGAQLELSYIVHRSGLKLKEYPSGFKKDLFSMTTHYFQIGMLNELQSGNLIPFAIVSIGAAIFVPDQATLTNEWFFAASLGMGAKVFLSERFGLRFQGRLLLPMHFAGGGLWCGTGGCNIGVEGSTSFVQADLQAGLIFALISLKGFSKS